MRKAPMRNQSYRLTYELSVATATGQGQQKRGGLPVPAPDDEVQRGIAHTRLQEKRWKRGLKAALFFAFGLFLALLFLGVFLGVVLLVLGEGGGDGTEGQRHTEHQRHELRG